VESGLRADTIEGAKLIAHGFFLVHEALASGSYPAESWLLLSPELPQLGIWKDWDRCKKLRTAVRERTSRYQGIMSDYLVEGARNPEQLELANRIFR
jgi:hypothetical protein